MIAIYILSGEKKSKFKEVDVISNGLKCLKNEVKRKTILFAYNENIGHLWILF